MIFIKDLVNKTCQERYGLFLEPQSLTLIWSFIVSVFCLGGVIGAFFSGRLIVTYGRKKTLLLNNFVAIAGSIFMLVSKTATSFEMIIVGRLLYGINAGIGFTSHALYVMECSPKRLRGLMGASVSFFIAFGRFFAQLLGFREFLGTEECWPWLVGFSGLIGTLQLVTLPLMPESPQYLLLDLGDHKGCEKAMQQLWGKHSYALELEELLLQKARIQKVRPTSPMELVRDRTVRWQLLAIIVLYFSLQMSGINVVYLYSFDVFRTAGLQPSQMRYATLGTSICEVMTSMTCAMVIESAGRRPLLIGGYLAMGTVLGLLTISLLLQNFAFWMPYCSMVLIFMYIFIFGCGPGGVTASLPGEIFTQEYKASAFTVGCCLSWFGLFIIGMIFPLIAENLGEYCFIIFIVFCIIAVCFVWFHIPETKNRSTLEIMDDFQRMHKIAGTKQAAQLAVDEFWTLKTTKL
ncbi:solute carrier family 2 member 11, like [Scleropages formosus]|uniref:solute carrier family 2 member 11, like n=1 Tax=Scleropages formosus TaxID=113540 RepID=UPI000878B447|nr:solute carrier family 2, facilitated glucose transporter member 9-like [Scleropages formosus]